MPYSDANDPGLPKYVQKLPDKKRRQWIAVFNSTMERCSGDDCEAKAFRNANGVVKVKSYTTSCKLPDITRLVRYKVFAKVCPECQHTQNDGDKCEKCGAEMKRELVTRTMAQVGSQVKCAHDSCALCATHELYVKSHPFYYCDEHVSGARDVLVKHNLQVESSKELEPGRWVEITDCKEYENTAIVALVPPDDVANGVALPTDGALSQDDLHVTMAYLGDTSKLDQKKTLGIVKGIASELAPIMANMNGLTRFTQTHKPDTHAVVLNVDAPEIDELRRALVDKLELEPGDHGFTPHMTLSYIPGDSSDMPDVLLPAEPVEFGSLWVFWGNERFQFPFAERGEKENVDRIDKIAKRIEKEPGKVDAEQIKKDLLSPWLASTMTTPASQQLQKVAARTFGHQEPKELKKLKIDWDLLMPMGGIYNITQEALKEQGFKENQTIPIYRPWSPTQGGAKGFEKGDEVRIKLNPLTSWTTDIKEALPVAEFFGTPTNPAYVLKTYVPIKSIVSTPHTGFGVPGTQEVITAGGEYEALVEARFG